MTLDQHQRLADVVKREQSRLRHFIRRRVAEPRDAEDVLQDIFSVPGASERDSPARPWPP